MTDAGDPRFVGRHRPAAELQARVRDAEAGQSGFVLVTGEAGMGKTTLVVHAVRTAEPAPLTVWGACWADGTALGFWPWTQALNALVAAVGRAQAAAVAGDDVETLASVITALGGAATPVDTAQARLRLFDSVARWLIAMSASRPVVVVLDDLHWADRSSLDLLDHLSRTAHTARLLIVGTFRHDEVRPDVRDAIASLTARAQHIRLTGLSADDVHALLAHLTSPAIADRWAESVHRRTGGQPFFVRELADSLGDETGPADELPTAVRDLIATRLGRLTPRCRRTLGAAAVLGPDLSTDVLAAVLDVPVETIDADVDEAKAAGLLLATPGTPRFAHDLVREAVHAELSTTKRRELHARAADALEAAHERGGSVSPAEILLHVTEAIAITGPERALRWAAAAAAADRARLALTEAAGRFERVRTGAARAGVTLPASTAVDALVGEADARARAGATYQAQELLADARAIAHRTGEPRLLGAVAVGIQRLGARFAMPRDPVVAVLDEARQAAAGRDPALAARLTAALARELAHSVPDHRSRADPLSREALAAALDLDDPATELSCLLARHDVLWTPGTAQQRIEITQRLVALAGQLGDLEQRAEALLLQANALLESGSPRFRDVLQECLSAYEGLGQPRHRYLALTRRAALALLDGQLDIAEQLIDEAALLGERIGEPDTGNVRMSQRLSLVQLRGDMEEQRAFAAEAVQWWVGAPVHAHAAAAGFFARAGDLAAARCEVDVVLDLGGWQIDRSYLWSVYVAQLAEAAALLHDVELARRLLDDLAPLADTCGVNGAVVAFAGSLAYAAGLAAATAGRDADARTWLEQALVVHRRLGARPWEELSRRALAAVTEPAPQEATAVLRRAGGRWVIGHGPRSVTVPDSKGWRDIAVLLARPGQDIHVLELVGSRLAEGSRSDVVDGAAIAAYRQRLRELADDEAAADADNDIGRLARVRAEHDAVFDELARVTNVRGRPRSQSTQAGERARKAVTARIRDAIRKLQPELPDLAAHLDRTILTGHWCRYRPDEELTWRVEA